NSKAARVDPIVRRTRAREEFEVREKSDEVGESIALERAPLDGPGASPDPKFSGSALPVEVPSTLLPSRTAAAERLQNGAAHDPVDAVPGPDAAPEKLLRGWRLIACVFLPFAA